MDINSIEKTFKTRDAIQDWAYIIHDKDETKPHYHIAIRLKNTYDTKYIAQWFGVSENFISRVKGRWSDILKYLTHSNSPDKHQYSDELVISNFDWTTERDKLSGNARKDEIINLINTGEIRAFNYTRYVSISENDRYSLSIKRAFDYRADKIKEVSRNMNAVFITGKSGTGKTTFSKKIAEEKGFSTYISSGSNDILDDYKGQDCIILDDLRPSSLGLSDLLKMLDNHTVSTVKSRYKNKVLECKLIIITTILDIDTFFNQTFKDDPETINQLKRRCTSYIRLETEYMYIKYWLDKSNEYGSEFKFPNNVLAPFNIHDLTINEQLDKINELINLGKPIIDEMKANIENYTQLDIESINNPFKHKK